jgi:menaquinone-dependent protoporphyrinogen oxidase
MKILIVHASRYGSTADVAERVGVVLREVGHDVVVWTACEMPSPRNYALVVVGGAVHDGRAVGDLRRYVTQYRGELASKRVALFAVAGNLRDDTEENHRQAEAALLPLEQGLSCIARGSFAGVVNPRRMSLPARFRMRFMKAVPGDDRTWNDVRAWASALSVRLADM